MEPVLARKSGSLASCSRRSAGTAASRRNGSPRRSQPSGSTAANRSWVGGCQVHRRFVASVPSSTSGSGSPARTVKRRTAFILATLEHPDDLLTACTLIEQDLFMGRMGQPGRLDNEGRSRNETGGRTGEWSAGH